MSALQRYDMEAMSYSGAWVKEKPSEDGDWVKADEAIAEVEKVTNTANFALALREEEIEAKDEEISRLRAHLAQIHIEAHCLSLSTIESMCKKALGGAK